MSSGVANPAPPTDPRRGELTIALNGLVDASAAAPATERLLEYLALIAQWNRVYNLTAVRDEGDMFVQHLLDCLALIGPLRRELASASSAGSRPRVLDVGSGAGLPGVVIAVVCPEIDVVCVDAVAKKASFIRQAAAMLQCPNLRAVHARVEAMTGPPFQVITSRAFASLQDFVRLTAMHLAPSGVWAAMKGKVPEQEIAALAEGVQVFHVEHLNVPSLQADRCIVWMKPR